MQTFGASGPAGALYKHFGFTPEQVAMTAREVVTRVKEA
jgi:transketolase